MKKHSDKMDFTVQRRDFLKKAVYITPSLIVLGNIVKPIKANADDFGGTPSDPNTD